MVSIGLLGCASCFRFFKKPIQFTGKKNPIAFFTFPQKITQGSVLVRVGFDLGE
jgi:hypothetical protein